MYGWTYSQLFFYQLWQAFVNFSLLRVYYYGLRAFQFDSPAGLSHILSSTSLTYSESFWLAGNIVVLVTQLSLLARMWKWLQMRITRHSEEANRDIKLNLASLIDLLPCWGLLRGSRSLHSFLRNKGPSPVIIHVAGSQPITFVFVSFLFVCLLWSDVRALRLVTLVFPLLGIDSTAFFFAMTTASNTFALQVPHNIFTGVHYKPRFVLASFFLWQAAIIGSSYWYSFILLPPLGAALVLRFLLVRYIPEYLVDPIPLPPSPITPTKPFCQVCQRNILAKMRSAPPKSDTSFTHHWTTRSLRKSATEGCRICATIWRFMTARQTEFCNWDMWGRSTTWEASVDGGIMIHSGVYYNLCAFRIFHPTDYQLKLPTVPPLLEDHTGSDTSLNLAKEWLSACIQHHRSCCDNTNVHFRPSRLLHISTDNHIRIHTSNEYPEALSYMTLSHCWGNAQFIQLRQSNEQALRHGIPWDSLPQTFKDAIRIARHLGTEYLWIDSFCILQDSVEDWLTESAMMGSVYANATCNIAASDASNSREGCLYPRNHRTIPLERLSCDSGLLNDESLPWYSDRLNGLYLRNASAQSDRLYSRAWVLQESILARRTLDCGRQQLFWRCDEAMASEEFPEGLPEDRRWKYSHPSHSLLGLLNSLSSLRFMTKEMKHWEARNQEALQIPGHRGNSKVMLDAYNRLQSPSEHWYDIVEIYSRMSLTKDTDRPFAIAGALDAFRPYLGEYWAGMWQHLLPLNLLWSTQKHFDFSPEPSRCYRPSPRRGPSWSWMSLEGPVYLREGCMLEHGGELLSQFLDAEVVSAHDIRLRIRAPLIHATWVEEWAGVVPRALLTLGFRPIIRGLCIRDSKGLNKWRVPQSLLGDDDVDASIDVAFDVASFEETVRDVELVAIRRKYSMVGGLVLQKNIDASFTRVGSFLACSTAAGIFLHGDETDVVLI